MSSYHCSRHRMGIWTKMLSRLPSDWLVTFKPQRTQCTVGDGSFALNMNFYNMQYFENPFQTLYVNDIQFTLKIIHSSFRPPRGWLYKSKALNWIERCMEIDIQYIIYYMLMLIVTWMILFLRVLIYALSSYEHWEHLSGNNYKDICQSDNRTDKWTVFDAILCNVQNWDEIEYFYDFEIQFWFI